MVKGESKVSMIKLQITTCAYESAKYAGEGT